MVKKLASKHWLNVVTLLLVGLILFLARNDLVHAWHLLGQVNIWIFLSIIPLQFLSYYASGAMMFSYLKSRGDLKNIPPLDQPKMALELNFVNHIFPSAGLSGASYMALRLGKLGINHGRATLAQVVRLVMQFASFAALMVIAVLWVTIDGSLTRFTILVASSLVTLILAIIFGTIYLLGSTKRLDKFESFIDTLVNKKIVPLFRRSEPVINREKMHAFFIDLYEDYTTLKADPKCLIRPFWWGIIFNIAEVSMFFITFLALGSVVNPAPILIALGLATLAGVFLVTPGGAGGYEAIMISFLTTAGVPLATTAAGVLLARTLLIVLTIASGYMFYNAAMKKHGKPAN